MATESAHEEQSSRTVKAKLYKGMPQVELKERVSIKIELDEESSRKVMDVAEDKRKELEGPISISLESLDIDMQHNQSFGMVAASTGCISNPGGPSC